MVTAAGNYLSIYQGIALSIYIHISLCISSNIDDMLLTLIILPLIIYSNH